MNPRRILFIRDDRLGDLVLALPLVRALRRVLPGAEISMLVAEYARPLVQHDPDIRQVIVSGRPETLRAIRQSGFDAALVLRANWSNAWLAFRAGIPLRLGPSARPFSFLFNRRIPLRRSRGIKSEAGYNLDFLGALGLDSGPSAPPAPGLRLPRAANAAAEAWLKKRGLARGRQRLVIVHPGSGGSAMNLDAAQYASLAQALARRFKARVLISGGPAEKKLLDEVAARVKPRPVVLDQALPLDVFAALLARASLFVSGSTGPMHVAAALGTPTLSFFPPVVPMSPVRWGPVGNRHAVLTPRGLGISCPQCRLEACPFYDCMRLISARQAVDAAASVVD